MDDFASDVGTELDTQSPMSIPSSAPAEPLPQVAPEPQPVEAVAPAAPPVVEPVAAPIPPVADTPPPAVEKDPNPLPGTILDDPEFSPVKREEHGQPLLPRLAKGHDASHITNLDTDFSDRVQKMIDGAPPAVRDALTVNSGYRSNERQAELFAQAVEKYGSDAAASKWVARPGTSQHNHGKAMDLGFGNDAARQWVHANAATYGLTFPMGHEDWHIEAIGGRDKGTTTPTVANTLSVPADIKSVIDGAAARTGADAGEMARFAKQESSFDPRAGAGSSSAKGLFQFTDGTWADMLKKHGDVYGLPSNASPFDPVANALMAGEYLKDNKKFIGDTLGRYKPGETYVTHFMGPTGGTNLIKLAESDPNAPAATRFPKAAEANHNVFYNRDGSMKTAKQVYDWGVSIGSGGSAPQTITSSGVSSTPGVPVYSPSQNAPAPILGSAAVKAKEDYEGALDKPGSWGQLAADTFTLDTTSGMMWAHKTFAPDLSTIPSIGATMDKWKAAGISEELINKRMPELLSGSHEQFLFEQAQRETAHRQNIAALGVPGAGANILMQMLDPVNVAAGIASGGIADYAVAARGLGMAARVGAQATAGAGSNLAVEAWQEQLGSPSAMEHPFFTAAWGAALGSVGGFIGRNPYTKVEASQLADLAEGQIKSMRDRQLNSSTSLSGDLSAARDPNAQLPIVNDAAIRAYSQADAPYTLWGMVRYDVGGKLKSSPNPLVRGLGSLFAEDGVGNADKSIPSKFSADQDMQRRHDKNTLEMWKTYAPAYDEWAKENNLNAITKMFNQKTFFDQLYDVDIGLVPKDAHGAAIRRMSAKLDELYAERAQDLQNPLRAEGRVGTPYPGFEAGAPVKNYRPRIDDLQKINEFRTKGGGDTGMKEWYKGAMWDNWDDKDLLDRVAERMVKSKHLRAEGVWEHMEGAKGGDEASFRNMLSEIGLSNDDIESAVKTYRTPDKAGDARGKHRFVMNEQYVMKDYHMMDGSSRDVTIKDFVKTNPIENYISYDRWHSGRTALMRVKMEGGFDPENPGVRTVLFDGLRTQNDYDAFIKHIQAKGADMNVGPEQMAKDIENLNFMHDRLLARPDMNNQGMTAQVLRAVRKYNFIRLMGQMGFAQAVEHGKIIGSLGFKAAYSQMPAFKRIVDGKGQLVFRNELQRELEAIGGQGADELRGLQQMHAEDIYAPAYKGVGAKINYGLDVGQRVISKVSGMHFVDGMLMRHVQKSIAQKFADLAFDTVKGGNFKLADIAASDLNRLRNIGLDDKMLERVLKNYRDNMTTVDGAMFSHKVQRLNLDQWKDQEARASFEKALYNWSRRIVLRNDIGNGATWMSKPLAQVFFQFRSFMLNSWAKDTLYNIHMRDMKSFATVTYSVMMGSMIYALQQSVQSVGRSDQQEFLKKKLEHRNLILAGIQRAGPSSILPMIIDTGLTYASFDPMFDFRTTAQPTDLILGNPTAGLITDVQKASSSLVQAARTHHPMSQQGLRNVSRTLPGQNTIPAMNLWSAMISHFPEKSEKLSKDERRLF